MNRKTLLTALLVTPLLLVSTLVLAKDPINTKLFSDVAIEGADAVAYFTESQYREGSKQFEHEWQGATWRFSSEENRALFAAAPATYAPQYGGYCAYAVSQGSTASIEPEQWSIVEGKLYLNYNAKIKARWLQDRDNYIVAADQNWPGVLD